MRGELKPQWDFKAWNRSCLYDIINAVASIHRNVFHGRRET